MMRSTIYNLYKAFKSKRALVMLLCLVSMFSLSAQTPRQDSGANGPSWPNALLMGQKVPDKFWNRKFLLFRDGDTIRESLAAYRGKMIVLDFWASGCVPCLLHQKEINYFKEKYKDDLVVIMVNSKLTKDKYSKIKNLYDNNHFKRFGMEHLESIIEDDYLVDLFMAAAFPTYIWIDSHGRLQLITYKNLLNRKIAIPFIEKL
ncbi:TlpA disulfide reductase family protein [Sphingobacterium sp.]|uniref:TlpA family protein disulfide reductase n=1 Tax=Sphingobacterium sp. TaxID=341027 RepID=UPI00289C7435|nr:TlpA disulfide reductase family protein [Sphingobacterium sp.]